MIVMAEISLAMTKKMEWQATKKAASSRLFS
jgi:hypothetical protein